VEVMDDEEVVGLAAGSVVATGDAPVEVVADPPSSEQAETVTRTRTTKTRLDGRRIAFLEQCSAIRDGFEHGMGEVDLFKSLGAA